MNTSFLTIHDYWNIKQEISDYLIYDKKYYVIGKINYISQVDSAFNGLHMCFHRQKGFRLNITVKSKNS